MTSPTSAEAACAFRFPSSQGKNYRTTEFVLHSRVAELVGDQVGRAFYDDDGGEWRVGPSELRDVVKTNILQEGGGDESLSSVYSMHPIYGSAIAFEPGVWTEDSGFKGGVPYPAASKACLEDASFCAPEAAASRETLQLSELKRNADGQTLYSPFAFRGPPRESAYENCSRDQPEFCPSMDLAHTYDYANITLSESEWYTAPRCLYLRDGTRSGYWTSPYFAPAGEVNMVTYSQPVISRSGKFLGVATIDITVDALCYGDQCVVDTKDTSLAVGIGLGAAFGTALLLFVPFWFYRRRKKEIIRRQNSTIRRNTDLLKRQSEKLHRKDAELKVFSLGTSKFGDAVNFVDALLKPESPLKDASEVQNLLLVKRCLIRGEDKTMHVPGNLTKARANRYIMKEFAGVPSEPLTSSASTVVGSPRNSQRKGTFDCLPEFASLGVPQQTRLCELLSLSNLRKWDFNVFEVSAVDAENTLLFVAWAVLGAPHSQLAMAERLGRKDLEPDPSDGYRFADLDLKIETGPLCDYLRAIQGGYEDNPYHNAIHAADVVQTLHSLIQMAEGDHFEREELFWILVAAAIHDVKHPGMNNAFQVNTLSDLALTHNDVSVLESEHSSHAFKLMVHGSPDKDDNLNFLRHLTTPKFAEIRTRIVEAVLHTDMSKHFSIVARIKNRAAGKSWGEIDTKLRGEILMFMLHLADISNPAKGGPMFELWTDRCLDEFFAQGDKERDLGLPISPNCDRNETKKPESQIGFINFVVKPAYGVLADIVPSVGEIVLPVIEKNLIYWEGQKGRKETV